MINAGLTGGEILEKTYKILCDKYTSKTITLSDVAMTEIADDSDWHRSKTGYMLYKELSQITINNKNWVLGLGEKGGDYPAEPFGKDILALEYEINGKTTEQISKELASKIHASPYFRNTLIMSMADGQLKLATPDSPCYCRFSEKMKEYLAGKFKEYVAQKPEYDRECVLVSTMDFPCTKEMTFKESFAEFLAETVEAILSKPPPVK
jgi:hypothetical protein